MVTKKITSPWWKLLFFIWLVLFVLGSVAYKMGANSLRSKTGASIQVDRSADYSLYRINDTAAFYYQPKTEKISLVSYGPAFPLFRLFGDYAYNREILNEPLQKGPWLYAKTPNYFDKGRVIAYNIKNGNQILKQTAADVNAQGQPAQYLDHDLIADDAFAVKADDIAKSYSRLSVPKESAIVFFSGFLVAGLLILLIWPFARKKPVM